MLVLVTCVAAASVACTESPASRVVQSDVLGTAGSFAVLAASTVTSTGPTTITGDMGLSPGTSITGFPPGVATGATHVADANAIQAQSDLDTAWTRLRNLPCEFTLSNAELGGLTLTPGVYCFTSPSAALTGPLTLDFQGRADATFVFQIASTLTTASDSSIVRTNGGSDCNVFWQLGSSATLGTGTRFRGVILASASITLTTGATVSGRLLAHTGAITLDSNSITACASAVADAGTVGGEDAGHDASLGGEDAAVDTGPSAPDSGAHPDAGHSTADAGTTRPDSGCYACIPGAMRWCHYDGTCFWGQQTCAAGGAWNPCAESSTRPTGCEDVAYDSYCCVNSGSCCEDDVGTKTGDGTGGTGPSVGTCGGVVPTTCL